MTTLARLDEHADQNASGIVATPADRVNILLVDDDPRNLDVLESILSSPEYRLVRAQSADDALRALITEVFALMVLDVRMPEMTGLELAQLIKQRRKTQHLPIIFLTAYYQEDEHVMRGYDAGAVDYLNKPCNPTVLRSKVAVFVDLFRANQALKTEIAERCQAELRVAERTAEVQQLVSQLRALATELTQAEQRERKRLARILHDYIQQILVSAQMQMASIRHDPTPERVKSMVQSVEALMREALDLSRSLTLELSPPILHEAGLAAGLKWLADRMAEKNQFKVELNLDSSAEPVSEAERFLLFECTRELLFNAYKHAGVAHAKVSLVKSDDGRIQVIVEDRGKGFDIDHLRSRGNDNATFGLFSIQQRLVHLGGVIQIESELEKGTRITLIAPSSRPPLHPDAESVDVRPDDRIPLPLERFGSAAITVLVVDDHTIMRQCLSTLLSSHSDIHVVGEACDGPKAIELAEALNPDVIIMDINLGEMSGLQATQIIVSKNRRTKIIGLSMYAESNVADAVINAGAVAYLTKGVAADELVATIRNCVTANTAAQ